MSYVIPNQAIGKEKLIEAIGPEVEAQSTRVEMVVQYTEIQVQVAGTKEKKGVEYSNSKLEGPSLTRIFRCP